jgi:NAD(P)-dependent dehydrogenase (short-subunit alcohol dehydrogenase family)
LRCGLRPGKPAKEILQIMKSPLKNKWVLITRASSGFGAAAAKAFGAEGAKLLPGARRVDRLEKPPEQLATRASRAPFCDEASQLSTGRLRSSCSRLLFVVDKSVE